MFGNGRENKNAIVALEARIDSLTRNITVSIQYVDELKVLVQALQTANEELVARVAELESRQNTIRDGLRAAVVKPTPLVSSVDSNTQIVTDHICGSICRPPKLCTYCCDTHRYYGATCSCSPKGYPHSETCKDWPGPSGNRTISYEGLTQSD